MPNVDDPLSPIRERYRRCGNSPDIHVNLETYIDSANDIPRLLAAVDAALKLADEWEGTAATLDGGTARANALLDCTASFRAAITTALAGGAGDG